MEDARCDKCVSNGQQECRVPLTLTRCRLCMTRRVGCSLRVGLFIIILQSPSHNSRPDQTGRRRTTGTGARGTSCVTTTAGCSGTTGGGRFRVPFPVPRAVAFSVAFTTACPLAPASRASQSWRTASCERDLSSWPRHTPEVSAAVPRARDARSGGRRRG